MSRRQISFLAGQLPAIVDALVAPLRSMNPDQWVTVEEVGDALARYGIDVAEADLLAAITIAVGRGTLRARGNPPRSVMGRHQRNEVSEV